MKKVVLITNIDSYFGYLLAYELLKQKRQDTKYRLLCHERQLTSDLAAMGGEVFELSTYRDPARLKHIFQGVSYVILIPENSLHCYAEGHCLIDAAKEYGVGYISMLSFADIDKFKNKKTQLDEHIQKRFDKESYCFFRTAILHQFFYYFEPMIENQNKIQLVLQDKVKWGTIDVLDLVEAIIRLSVNEDCKQNQTIFEFTPVSAMATKDIVLEASVGLGIEDMTYEQVDATILCNYLNEIHEDNRFKERLDHVFPLGQYLNHHLVQLYIEYQQLLNQLQELNTTKDLGNVIKRDPTSVEAFFKQNKHQFQDLK